MLVRTCGYMGWCYEERRENQSPFLAIIDTSRGREQVCLRQSQKCQDTQMFRPSLQIRCVHRCGYTCSAQVLVRGGGCELVPLHYFKLCALTAGPCCCHVHDTLCFSFLKYVTSLGNAM